MDPVYDPQGINHKQRKPGSLTMVKDDDIMQEDEQRRGDLSGATVTKTTLLSHESYSLKIPDDESIVGIGVVCSPYTHRVRHSEGPDQVTDYQDFRGLEVYSKNQKGQTYTVGRIPDTRSDPNASVKDKIMFGDGEYLRSFSVWMNLTGNVRQLHKIAIETNLNNHGPFGTTGPKADNKWLNKSFKYDIDGGVETLSINLGTYDSRTRYEGAGCCICCNREMSRNTFIAITGLKVEKKQDVK